MTDRRRPAGAGRVLAGGLSAAAALGLIAGWSASADAGVPASTAAAPALRVVITDPAIDRDAAIAAALDAHARGLTRAAVTVAQPGPPSDLPSQTHAGHSATRAS